MVDNFQAKKQKRAAETKKGVTVKKATKTIEKVEPKVWQKKLVFLREIYLLKAASFFISSFIVSGSRKSI